MLRVEFEDYGGEVNERFLRQRMDRIAKFNPRDPEIIDQYRSFFASIGSHVITAVNYGGRLQLVGLLRTHNQHWLIARCGTERLG